MHVSVHTCEHGLPWLLNCLSCYVSVLTTVHMRTNAAQVPVLEAYAMTEASHQMCANPLPSKGPRKPGTVGPAQGSVKVAVLDAQNRCDCVHVYGVIVCEVLMCACARCECV